MSSRAAKSIMDSLDDLLKPENQHLIPEEWKKSLPDENLCVRRIR